jgi:hypothetical protein
VLFGSAEGRPACMVKDVCSCLELKEHNNAVVVAKVSSIVERCFAIDILQIDIETLLFSKSQQRICGRLFTAAPWIRDRL